MWGRKSAISRLRMREPPMKSCTPPRARAIPSRVTPIIRALDDGFLATLFFFYLGLWSIISLQLCIVEWRCHKGLIKPWVPRVSLVPRPPYNYM